MTMCHMREAWRKEMPKITFFNLPELKRNKLIKAAETEFAKVPLAQASISNIVKSAGIPRGSFYQYFENKEDAFYFLLEEQSKQRKEHFLAYLQGNDGDVIVAFEKLFHDMIEELSKEDKLNFLKNALMNVTHEIENTFTEIFEERAKGKEQFIVIEPLINKAYLNISEEKEFFHVIQILTSVTFRNLVDKFSRGISDEEALENFTIEMNLLKYGLYK